jgi:hypothetical protein
MEDAIHAVEPYRHHWNVETGRHHSDSTAERFDVAGRGALTLRKIRIDQPLPTSSPA